LCEILNFRKLFPVLLLAVALPIQAAEIKKCQDENGQWHYGDLADDACGLTEVTRLNEQGSIIGKEPLPPTQQQLDDRAKAKKEAAAAKVIKDKQRRRDKSLVQIYSSEEVINSTRDRKLESIDNNLEVMQKLKEGILSDLNKLKERKQSDKVKKLVAERERAVKSYERVISQSLVQRESLEDQYAIILRDFRAASIRLQPGS
jgi:hypothetical protein